MQIFVKALRTLFLGNSSQSQEYYSDFSSYLFDLSSIHESNRLIVIHFSLLFCYLIVFIKKYLLFCRILEMKIVIISY